MNEKTVANFGEGEEAVVLVIVCLSVYFLSLPLNQ